MKRISQEDRYKAAYEERNRTISRMTSRIYDLNGTTGYIITKLESHGLLADAEILRMAMRKLWR